MAETDRGESPLLSVVVPVRNEAGNVAPLIAEIERACATLKPFEVIYVDDGSSDATAAEIATARLSRSWLRGLRHEVSCGQSAAVRSGVRAARAPVVVTLDGDGQNDPAFIPQLYEALLQGGERIGLAAGQRLRRVGGFKKLQSRIANGVRGAILRDVYLALPYFDALHRFMPALVKREGLEIAHVDVVDRPRRAGRSNYGMFDRLWVGIMDLCGVWWLIRRRRRVPVVREVG